MSPRVSIVMPAYNAARLIGESIDSVRAQTWAAWELIVVNDGSTDATAQVVAERAAADERIRLIRQANGGQAAARNAGIAAAGGELIAFLDADDLWKPEKLRLQIEAIERTGAALVYTGFTVFGESAGTEAAYEDAVPFGVRSGAEILPMLYERNFLVMASVMIEREAVEQAGLGWPGLFDPGRDIQTVEDYELWLRMAAAGLRFCGIEGKLTRYRRHPDAMTVNRIRMLAAEAIVLKRHAGRVAPDLAQRRRRGVYRRLVSLLAAEGRYDEARENMDKLHACDPESRVTRVQRLLLRLAPARYNQLSERLMGLLGGVKGEG